MGASSDGATGQAVAATSAWAWAACAPAVSAGFASASSASASAAMAAAVMLVDHAREDEAVERKHGEPVQAAGEAEREEDRTLVVA